MALVLCEWGWGGGGGGVGPPAPWPWADARPVARISVPRLSAGAIVLEGASGHAPPFGPGHVGGTALPGRAGHSVVAAHRGTDFDFLRSVRMGEQVVVERPGGGRSDYWVVDKRVIDTRTETLTLDRGARMLTLVTHYPFEGSMTGGPLRYAVTAVADRRMPSVD